MTDHQLKQARKDREAKLAALYAAIGEAPSIDLQDDKVESAGCCCMLMALLIMVSSLLLIAAMAVIIWYTTLPLH